LKDQIKIKLNPNQTLNKNIWKSFKSNHISKSGQIIRKTLNKEQNIEYDLIKKLSEKLIKRTKFVRYKFKIDVKGAQNLQNLIGINLYRYK
jgi:hypothetical protein